MRLASINPATRGLEHLGSPVGGGGFVGRMGCGFGRRCIADGGVFVVLVAVAVAAVAEFEAAMTQELELGLGGVVGGFDTAAAVALALALVCSTVSRRLNHRLRSAGVGRRFASCLMLTLMLAVAAYVRL